MRAAVALVSGLVAALSVLEAGARGASQPAAVVARLDAFLREYEVVLSSVVARERFDQYVFAEGRNRDTRQLERPLDELLGMLEQAEGGRQPERRRSLESEVAFIALPGEAGWLGLRHVQAIDGAAVRGSGRSLEALLTRGWASARSTALQLLAESARHNLGSPRTINLPNLPLELLHARNRGRFAVSLDGHEEIDGRRTTRVVLDERATPSLIQGAGGANLMSTVTAWVDDDDGRLARAEVRSQDRRPRIRPFQAVIRVDFADDAALGLRVPVAMRERFFVDPFDVRGGVGVGVARYDRFRRFDTSARVRPPG